MNHLLAMKISKFLTSGMEDITNIKVCYFLETIIGELEKCIIILLLFFAIGEVEYGILMLAVLIALRPYIGGVHRETFLGCLMYTIVVCILPLLICKAAKISVEVQIVSELMFALYIIWRAPVKSKYRPLYKGVARIKIKLKAAGMLLLVNLTAFLWEDYREEIVIMTIIIFLNAIIGEIINYKKSEEDKNYERDNRRDVSRIINGNG